MAEPLRKLLEFFEDGRLELYNLADDIAQKHDLATSNTAKRDEVHKKLFSWRRAVDAPMPTAK